MENLKNRMPNATKAHLYIKRSIEVISIVALCVFIIKILNYIYVNDCSNRSASWKRDVINDFYMQEQNIDYIYLGSSHVFMDVIPAKLDEINGKNNFNLATSAQPYMASYYLLKEALKYNEPKHVYLEMYYMIPYAYGDLDNAQVITMNWNVLYQMPLSLNKLNYEYHLANKKYGIMTFFPVRQFSEHTFDTAYIKSILEQKKQRITEIIFTSVMNGLLSSRKDSAQLWNMLNPVHLKETQAHFQSLGLIIIRIIIRKNISTR